MYFLELVFFRTGREIDGAGDRGHGYTDDLRGNHVEMVGAIALHTCHRGQSSASGEWRGNREREKEIGEILARANFFQHLEGAVVALSADGRLEACYLGSEPSLFVAPPLHPRGYDYTAAERELSKLREGVRARKGNGINKLPSFHDSR